MLCSSGRLHRLQQSFEASVETASVHLADDEQTVMGLLRLQMSRAIIAASMFPPKKVSSQSAKSNRSPRTMISQETAGLQLNNSHMALGLHIAYGLISRSDSRD